MQEVEVCIASVGVLGDISRALEAQLVQYSDRIMQVLLATLSDPSVDRTIKPQILSAFGDIALAVNERFETYLAHVLPMLRGAQTLSVQQQQSGSDALFEYNTALRLGILEAYAGIVHALDTEKAAQYLNPEASVSFYQTCFLCCCCCCSWIRRLCLIVHAHCSSLHVCSSSQQEMILPG